MHETHSLRERFLVFFKIFVPILIYQFANFSAAFVDTTMTGQYDALHLAGVAMALEMLRGKAYMRFEKFMAAW